MFPKVIKTEGTKLHLITSRAFLYFLPVATFGVFPRGSSTQEVIFVLWERSSKDNVLDGRLLEIIVRQWKSNNENKVFLWIANLSLSLNII